MKSTTQYLGQSWRLWKSHVKDSSIIVALQLAACLVMLALLVPGAFIIVSKPVVGLVYVSVMLLAVVFTLGLLYYYVPVCFQQISRDKPLSKEAVKVSYIRALGVCLFAVWPLVLSEILNTVSNFGLSLAWRLPLSLIVLGLSVFALIWIYMTGTLLPFIAHDNPDESVMSLTRRMIRLMDGYKGQLFCIDLLILVGPFVLLYVLLMVGLLAVIIPLSLHGGLDALSAGSPESFGIIVQTFLDHWKIHAGVGSAFLIVLLIMQFVLAPMQHLAHVCFYEDLIAEREGQETPVVGQDAPEVQEAEEAEVVEHSGTEDNG